MGNNSSRTPELTELYNPGRIAAYLKDEGICDTQTTVIIPSLSEKGKMIKKPAHSWMKEKRNYHTDTALMIMTGDVLVIDIDDPVDDITRYVNLPDNCWVDYTASGGCHIYLNKDDDIYEYSTTIGLKLWGFEHVDILIKNGFAYAGGTTYRHPITNATMAYVWDNERNPLTVGRLSNIPTEWKREILKNLEKSNKEFISSLKPWILGCSGVAGECHGCVGLVPTRDIEFFTLVLKKLLERHKGGIELFIKWVKKYSDDNIDNKHWMYNTCDPYDYMRVYESIKKESTHTKMYKINEFLERRQIYRDHTRFIRNRKECQDLIKILEKGGADSSIINEFKDLIPSYCY